MSKKIIFITESFLPYKKGGTELYLYNVCKALLQKGVTMHVCTFSNTGQNEYEVDHIPVTDHESITEVLKTFLHKDFILEWNGSTGFLKLDYQGIIDYTDNIAKSFIKTKTKIVFILNEKNMVSVKYSLSVKTIENHREEVKLANFFVIWEIKDDKLYRGYQMSQLS